MLNEMKSRSPQVETSFAGKKLLILVFICMAITSYSQTSKLAYPIIFLHGLVSNDNTWTTTANYLGGEAKVFDVCLNHDGNNSTANLTTDIDVIGWRDGNNNPSPNRLYIMNFDNSRFSASGHGAHTLSNQAAIYKQGVALKAMIQAVLAIENTDKVILVGHSMGGLEIREYLQRGYNGTSGAANWINPSSADGHKVAKVVTIGTPHQGSDHTGLGSSYGADENSDAERDLRYNKTQFYPLPSFYGIYLFGGSESSIPSSFYNKNINCNESSSDVITALTSGNTYNASMPLPLNIPYCWIRSNTPGGAAGDGLVEYDRQWLYSGSNPTPSGTDTLLMKVNHLEEPNDYFTIIRGLDEPSDISLAFSINSDQDTKGYITFNSGWAAADVDRFKFVPAVGGTHYFNLVGASSGVNSFKIYDGATELGSSSGPGMITVNNLTAGQTYYIEITGTATSATFQNPYTLTTSTTPLPVELVSFTAQVKNNSVDLKWMTATEVNNYGFNVERLARSLFPPFDGIKGGWKMVGFVQGSGTSSSPKYYYFKDTPTNCSSFIYRLKQIDLDGTSEYSNEVEVSLEPSEFRLFQNYPNPFNPGTIISYQLPVVSQVTLKVYDILGNEVTTLVNEIKTPGIHTVKFDGKDISSGIYYYRLSAGNFNVLKKFLLIK